MSDSRRIQGGASAPGFYTKQLPRVTMSVPAGVAHNAQRPIVSGGSFLADIKAAGQAMGQRTTNAQMKERWANKVPGAAPYRRDAVAVRIQAEAQHDKRTGRIGKPRHQRESLTKSPIQHHYLLWGVVISLVFLTWN